MADQPNILLIHTDQHRFDCVGANGHPFLQTPHLDRLAHEGVNFNHAFSPIPVCIPARNSLLYGQWPTEHLSIANWNTEASRPATGEGKTLSACLGEVGYDLKHVGKWHIHGDNLHGFDYYAVTHGQGAYINPSFETKDGKTNGYSKRYLGCYD